MLRLSVNWGKGWGGGELWNKLFAGVGQGDIAWEGLMMHYKSTLQILCESVSIDHNNNGTAAIYKKVIMLVLLFLSIF